MADSYIFDTDISNATFYSGDDVITLNGKLAYKDGWDTRGEDRIWAGEGDDTITLNGGGDRINANGHVWDTFVEGEDGDVRVDRIPRTPRAPSSCNPIVTSGNRQINGIRLEIKVHMRSSRLCTDLA